MRRRAWPGVAGVAAVLYVGIAASVAAFICWNRGVAIVGVLDRHSGAAGASHLEPVIE